MWCEESIEFVLKVGWQVDGPNILSSCMGGDYLGTCFGLDEGGNRDSGNDFSQ
jgi:hypothetical protein